MKLLHRFLFAAALVTAAAPSLVARERTPVANGPARPTLQYRAGTILLKLQRHVPNQRNGALFQIKSIDDVLERLGADSREPLFPLAPYTPYAPAAVLGDQPEYSTFDRVYMLHFSGPFDAQWAADQLKGVEGIEWAEPYYIFPLLYTPNDPRLGQQYWVDALKLKQAWDVTKGDTNVAIGIIDTGVEWNHEDLLSNIAFNRGEDGKDAQNRDKRTNGVDDDANGFVDDYAGWDMVGNPTLTDLQQGRYQPDNNPSPTPMTSSGYEGYHGTAVAGCASAAADNGKGIAGAGFRSRIVAIKCAADSVGTSAVIGGYEGIRYAADRGARVINCSWGAAGDPANTQGIQSVIDYAYSKGALVISASGNEAAFNDATPHFPSDLKHVLSVGATTSLDSAADFSNYGVGVDVWAPGASVSTTYPGALGGYTRIDGTSFSSPIVAGIAALIFAKHPDWTPDQVAMQLRSTGERFKLPNPQLAPYFFHRVNAFRAVTINDDLAATGNTLPGVGLESYTINGKATDTIKSTDQSVTVQLRLKNYLAPTKNLKITAFPNQALTTTSAFDVPVIATMSEATQEIQVKVNPNAATLYSEGHLQLVLQLNDGDYEDFISVRVPVYLPGFHTQSNPLSTSVTTLYSGASIDAPTPNMAWAISNVQTSPTAFSPYFTRTFNGTNWTSLRQVPPGQEPLYCIEALNDKVAWAGSGPSSGQAGIFRTVNNGGTWTRASVSSITPFVNSIHMYDSSNGVFLGDPLAGNWGIGVTTDAGATWRPLSTPVAASTTEAGWNNSIAAYGDHLWFGTNNRKIFHSSDRGRTWTFASTPGVNSLGLAFANANDGLAVFSVTSTTGGENMIAASRDGGATWTRVSDPHANAAAHGVTFIPGTTRAFVSTQNGMFETKDFGASWTQVPSPPIQMAGTILTSASDSTGSWSTFGTNVYSQIMAYREVIKPTVSVREENSVSSGNVTLHQNEPNPFTNSSTITFDLKQSSYVAIDVYDVLGNRLLALANGRYDAGTHSVKVDAAQLPAGTYVYVLNAGGEQTARRMIITR